MRKLNAAVDRFAYSHPNFGIPNLMKIIVAGNLLVYLLTIFSSPAALSFLAFDWNAIKAGELWRLVTFIFMPGYSRLSDLIWMGLFLYFYYFIGNMLEREWGTAKFTLYYGSGVVLTALAGIIGSLVSGTGLYIAGASYINMSMFLAFAVLYPDMQVLFMMIIPIKIKWLALLDGAWFLLHILQSLLGGYTVGWLVPVIALLNFLVFFWTDLMDLMGMQRARVQHQTSHQTIQFKSAVKQQQKKEAERGYRHKCEVCGRTDTDYPDLEFRYCSRCAGYHCFCEDHIFNHEHFKE